VGGRQPGHAEAAVPWLCTAGRSGVSCRQTSLPSSSQSRSEGSRLQLKRQLRAITHCSGEISACFLSGSSVSVKSFSQAEQIFVCLEEGATGDWR